MGPPDEAEHENQREEPDAGTNEQIPTTSGSREERHMDVGQYGAQSDGNLDPNGRTEERVDEMDPESGDRTMEDGRATK
jgi:hypothetical protein